MTTFAEKSVTYSDGQVNVIPLPEAIMANGFIPETRDAPGMPLAAQHLNWLFRDLYRKASELQALSTSLKKETLPAWVPIPCPFETPPEGYLKCNGAAFDMDKYPELARAYPNGVLPDLRGEFIRGWDDGRGVDANRQILSYQKGSINSFDSEPNGMNPMALYQNTVSTGDGRALFGYDDFDIKEYPSVYTVWNHAIQNAYSTVESGKVLFGVNRPRNIAFLYIVRAA